MAITLNGTGTITGISAGGLPNNIVTANNIVDGSVGLNLTSSTAKTVLASYPNTTAYPNVSTATITLSAAQAPIGSYVLLGVEIYSGNSSGNQYCYISQSGSSNNVIGGYVEDWYYYDMTHGIFAINTSADRTFTMSHASIVATNVNDSRAVVYYGYFKPTP